MLPWGPEPLMQTPPAAGIVAWVPLASAQATTGSQNTIVGHGAAFALLTGSNNTLLGAWTDVTNSAIVNATAIGFSAKGRHKQYHGLRQYKCQPMGFRHNNLRNQSHRRRQHQLKWERRVIVPHRHLDQHE
jgi:hypothetical protein